MKDKNYILQMIKQKVQETEPGATLILYGSYARGEEREDSDIDILILIDSDKEKITGKDRDRLISPICRVELETEKVISPVFYTKKGWANHKVSPYYENINKEGIVL